MNRAGRLPDTVIIRVRWVTPTWLMGLLTVINAEECRHVV